MITQIEALTFDEIEGGTLPPAAITCDGGNSGKCFKQDYQEGPKFKKDIFSRA